MTTKNTRVYACAKCGQRQVVNVPCVAVLCHNKHRAVVMRVVEDTSSTTRGPA